VEYERTESYAASKLMNVLFTKEIARYFEIKLQQNVSHKASKKTFLKRVDWKENTRLWELSMMFLAWFLFWNIQFHLLRI
jgi:hypothetical protein